MVLPSLRATLAATTLREYATASANDITPIALWSASSTWARPPSTRRIPVSRSFVPGFTTPEPRAAVAVSILNTDPGS